MSNNQPSVEELARINASINESAADPSVQSRLLEAAKEIHSEQWHGLTYDQMIARTVACLARHFP